MAKNNIFRNIFKLRRFKDSLNLAIKGIIYLFLYHHNMRIIFLSGIAVLLFGLYINLRGFELVILCITITLVFMAEIFNTAIEIMFDMLTDKYHTSIKVVKDISAAVALIAVMNAIAVGYILFVRKWPWFN